MPINTAASQSQIVCQLMTEAKQAARNERRSAARIPFFCPVSIMLDGRCYAAFSREISATAIGLMHYMELPLGEVEISISTESGNSGSLLARIARCESRGNGWYISGSPITSTPTGPPATDVTVSMPAA